MYRVTDAEVFHRVVCRHGDALFVVIGCAVVEADVFYVGFFVVVVLLYQYFEFGVVVLACCEGDGAKQQESGDVSHGKGKEEGREEGAGY